ncbi:MAG TPA: hypothetical protein VJH68_03055 [Candidatus Nanoarchaeia archaeon]|nr:hypothetical protein [Candidatus Nanoarchaeia archaeon]
MVKRKRSKFECEECHMWYRDEKLAKQCKRWCRKHHSCNLEIIKNAA